MTATSHCGYVGLVGRPNVGKSTLMNHVLQQKISITSRKPQTTRRAVLGVDTDATHQAIYVDTPGIHTDTGRALNRYMVRQAANSARDVDILVTVMEWGALQPDDERVLGLARSLKPSLHACLAVITKVDLLKDKQQLLPKIGELSQTGLFDEIVPVAALRQDGIQAFRQAVFTHLPVGPHLFGEDDVTDQSQRQMVAELVREKIMRQLGDELPHRSAVSIVHYAATPDRTVIHAEIVVERDSQKAIVIGKGGQRLKQIGTDARRDIERLLSAPVNLQLWVKVRKDWTKNAGALRQLGYD